MDVETTEIPFGQKDTFSASLYSGQELQVRARAFVVVCDALR
jgi:hypothetical protein